MSLPEFACLITAADQKEVEEDIGRALERRNLEIIVSSALMDGAPVAFENFEYLYQYPFFPSRSNREKDESQNIEDKNVDEDGAASLPEASAFVSDSTDSQLFQRQPWTAS